MTGIDTLIVAGQVLAVNATAGDWVVHTVRDLAPGVLAAAAGTAVWRTLRWTAARRRDRALRRAYAARAYRLCRVADQADAYLAMPTALVNAHLEAQLNAETVREEEK